MLYEMVWVGNFVLDVGEMDVVYDVFCVVMVMIVVFGFIGFFVGNDVFVFGVVIVLDVLV